MSYVRHGRPTQEGQGRHPQPSRRRTLAVAGSLGAHLLMFALAFSSASGDLVSASGRSGGPEGPVFEVTLVSLPSSTASAAAIGAPRVLTARSSTSAMPVAPPSPIGGTTSGLQSLFETLRSQQARPPSTPSATAQSRVPPQGVRSPSPGPSSESVRPRLDRHTDADGDLTGSESTGALWGAIEPCWRNLGVRGRVPVVLEVALNATGDLRRPPRIVRDPAALLTEPRLQAEATALAAIAACAPRGDLRLSNRVIRLEFPAAP